MSAELQAKPTPQLEQSRVAMGVGNALNVILASLPTSKRISQNSLGPAGADFQTLDRLGVAKRRANPAPPSPARPPTVAATWMTPGEVATLLRIRPEKVLGWVHDGRLLAVNVASDGATRPRWRISQTALETFLASRSNRAAGDTAPVRRRSRIPTDEVVEYF